MLDEKLRLSSGCRTMKRDSRIIIVNTYNGEWFRLTEECYNILNSALEKGLNREQLISCLEDPEDKIYFNRLLDELNKLQIVTMIESEDSTIHSVGFSITHRCNLSCTHCSYNALTMDESEYLSTRQAISIAEKIISFNPVRIVISGGEPLVRDDFFEIMDFIKKHYSGELSLMTNGVLIDETNVERLISYFSSFEISIDGVDEETCSKIRGKGVFGMVLSSIKILQNHGMKRISLSMVLTRQNEQLADKFEELNTELGTKSVKRIFAPLGRGLINKDTFLPNYGEYSINTDDTVKTGEEKRIKPTGFCCDGIRKRFHVNADGRIYPCASFQKEGFDIGNLLYISDPKKYFSDKEYTHSEGYKKFNYILPYNNQKCKNCDINLFCSTCPFHTYSYSSDEAFDKYCEIKRSIYSFVWG
jgi:radical SAM protein with 4Fe4S-binding SPASM domain